MKLALAVVALGASACVDPAVELSLRLPTGAQLPADFDLSCISTVDVLVVGNDQGDAGRRPDIRAQCLDLATAPTSFADLRAALSGQVELELPSSGLAGVELRGTRGSCADPVRYQEAAVYGGAAFLDGMDELSIPVLPNISCNRPQTYTVTPIDLLATVRDRTCVPPDTQGPLVFGGNIRPRMLGREFDRMLFEFGPSAMAPDPQGRAVISSHAATTGTSCIAMGFDSLALAAGSCINPGAATLCANPGEIELPAIDFLVAGMSIETALIAQYGDPVFGAVVRASTTLDKVPIQGATIELDEPDKGTVVYVRPGAGKLERIEGATSTGPDGLFMVYLEGEPTTLTIRSGASQQRLVVASTPGRPATVLAALP